MDDSKNNQREKEWYTRAEHLRKEGMTCGEISKALNVNRETVKAYLRRTGLSKIDPRRNRETEKLNSLNVTVIGEWIKNKNKWFRLKCNECGYEYDIQRANLMNGTQGNCQKCKKQERQRKKKEQRDKRFWSQEFEQITLEFSYCRCGQVKDKNNRLCEKCKREHEKMQRRKYRATKEAKRKMRINNQMIDKDINIEQLYTRDKGKCYICGIECDWNDGEWINGAFVTHERYPTIDHVKPLCKGGLHSWDNVKLACHRCNTLKGSNPPRVQ